MSNHGLVQFARRSHAFRAVRERAGAHFRKLCRRRSYPQLAQTQPALKNPQTCFEGPFGEVLRATYANPLVRQSLGAGGFRFSTKYQDDETDLLYYGYRYYNASTGRWLSRDPILENAFAVLNHTELGRAMNQACGSLDFTFAYNNPICLVDVLGLSERDIQKLLGEFMKALKTMCKDGRCCPERGWLQNPIACLPWSAQEGCTSQVVDVYVALYPTVTGGHLDDKWTIDTDQITVCWPIFYHNIVVIRPQGGHDGNLDSIILDSWHGCYTIRHWHTFPIPPRGGFFYYTDDTHCFKCKDLKK